MGSRTRLRSHLFKGTAIEFFRANPGLLGRSADRATLVLGCNCGFGNWENPGRTRYDLLFEWLTDLYFLTATKLPLIFSCANDYADRERALPCPPRAAVPAAAARAQH